MFSLRNLVKGIARSTKTQPALKSFNKPNLNIYLNYYKPYSFSTSTEQLSQTYKDALNKYTQGIELSKQKKYTESIALLEQVLQSFSAQQDKSLLPTNEVNLLLQAYFQLGKIHEKHQDITEAAKLYNEAFDIISKTSLSHSVEAANLNNAMGRIKLKQGQNEEAKDYLRKASEIFKQLGTKNTTANPQFIENAYMMAVLYGDSGQLDDALQLLEGILNEVQGQESVYEGELDLALVYLSVGNMWISKQNIPKSLDYWEKGLELSVKRHGEHSLQGQHYCLTVTQVLLRHELYEQARQYAEKNLEIVQKVYDENHPKVAEGYLTVAAINLNTQQHEKALEGYKKAAEILSTYPKQYHDQVSFAYLTMSETYVAQRQFDEGKTAFENALSIALEQLGTNSVKVADYYYFWAEQLRVKIDNFKGARLYYTKALDIYKNNKETTAEVFVPIYYNLGSLFFHEGNIEEAIKNLHECINQAVKSDENNGLLEDTYNLLASIYFQKEKYQESGKYFQKAVEFCEKTGHHDQIDVYYRNLGLAHEYSGDIEKGVDAYRKALDTSLKARGKEDEITQSNLQLLVEGLKKQLKMGEAEELRKKYEVKSDE